jgi:hypothetical protein
VDFGWVPPSPGRDRELRATRRRARRLLLQAALLAAAALLGFVGGMIVTSPARGTEAAKGKGSMNRDLKVGCAVVFVDSQRRPHAALVTAWHGGVPDGTSLEDYKASSGWQHPPCLNLVLVSGDANKADPYGRQLERHLSVGHGDAQTPPRMGVFWLWPDEA